MFSRPIRWKTLPKGAAAGKATSKEEKLRRKKEHMEQNNKFLNAFPKTLTEADIVMTYLVSRKIKQLVPAKMIAEYTELRSEHNKKLLDFRNVAEKAAAIKDPKQVAKKFADVIQEQEAKLQEFEKASKCARR